MNLADPSTTRASPRPASKGSPTPEHVVVFEAFEGYRFSDDPDFRAGLPTVIGAMRGTKRTAAQVDEMMGRAQWFYYTRLKHVSLPWEAYRAWSSSTPSRSSSFTPSSSSSSPSASSDSCSPVPHNIPKPKDPLAVLNNLAEAKKMMDEVSMQGVQGEGMSFGMLCRLISEGRADEVPVKQISDQLNASPPSDSLLPTRLKPWEQQSQSAPSAPTFPLSTQSPPVSSFFPQSNSTPSLHTSPRNSISLNPSPQHSYSIHPSPPFDPSSMYLQNSTASSSSLHSLPSAPMPMKQPSPPGTSSSFNNPSLAPSPPSHPSALSPTSDPFDFHSAFDLNGNLGGSLGGNQVGLAGIESKGLGPRSSTDYAFQNLSMDPPQVPPESNNAGYSMSAMSPFTYPTAGLFGEGITPKEEHVDPLAVGVGLGKRPSQSHGDVLNQGF